MGILNFAGLSIVGWVATWRLIVLFNVYFFNGVKKETNGYWMLLVGL